MRALRSDRGASAIEYAGLIVLAALILGSLTAIGIPGTIRDGLTPALCKIVGGTNCGGRTANGADTGSGRQSDGNPPPGSNQLPAAGGKDPGLLPSLGRTLAYHVEGFSNFAGFHLWRRAPSGYYRNQKPFNDVAGVARELWEQAKGVGNFAKMTWCATGLCPDSAVKEARDNWSYLFHHPGEAAKQAGYSIVEPCIKTYRAPNQGESSYWYGRCATSLITTVVGAKGLGKVGKLSKLGKAAEGAGKLSKAAKATEDVLKQARRARDAAKSKNILPGDAQKIFSSYRALSPAEKAKFLDKLNPQELNDLWANADNATRSDILQNASKDVLKKWKPPEPPFKGAGRWTQFKGKVFDGAPKYGDIAQGQLGNCWCLASLGAVARQSPRLIKKMIKENPNGTYTVTFGDGYRTTVTGLLPKSGARIGKAGWPAILEKAYAQRYGGYDKLGGATWPHKALQQITGKPGVEYWSNKPKISNLATLSRKGNAFVVSFTHNVNLPNFKARGIIPNHAYSVVKVDKKNGTVTLANPHGPHRGLVTLTEKELNDPNVGLFGAPTR